MNRTGLLVVSNMSRIANTFKVSREHVFETLYVQLYVPKAAPALTPPRFCEIVKSIYKNSLSHCFDLDVRVLIASDGRPARDKCLDVLMLDSWMPADEIKCIRAKFDSTNFVNFGEQEKRSKHEIKVFDKDDLLDSAANNVVLGGTFDRIHIGHKILLTEAAIRTKQRLVVGVTDYNMIQSKILYELLLPTQKRIDGVLDFLTSIDNTIKYEVVPIRDAFGPTQSDPNLDLIVVSQETFKGGEKCNEIRDKKDLSQLAVHCIDVIELDQDSSLKERKVSSSNQRLDLLGTRYREPAPNATIPNKPYVIGLIGGVSVGLNDVSNILKSKGAVVVDCDLMARQLCSNSDWRDEKSRDEWPVLRKRIQEQVASMYSGKQLCVLQGDIVFEAGWQEDCHEIWSVIISIKEALKRLIDEQGKTQQEAHDILVAHTDNKTLVEHANVVLSTNWNEEFTKVQVERAWTLLKEKLTVANGTFE